MRVFEAFIHESVRGDDLTASRHHAFLVSHITGPVLAAFALPLHWVVSGGLDPVVLQALCWMMIPALVAIYLSNTGALTAACALSTVSLAVLVGFIALHTGGISSFALFWLLAVPVEAAMSGSRRVVIASVPLCAAMLVLLVAVEQMAWLPPSRVAAGDAALYDAVGLTSALLYVGLMAATIESLHRQSDRAVEENARRFRLLAENATDVISRHASNGAVSFVSGAIDRLVGCDPAMLLGPGYRNLVHPEDRGAFVAAFDRAAQTRELASAEFRLADGADGHGAAPSYKWVELKCRPIPSVTPGAGPCELVAISRDITERRQRQEELRRALASARDANRAKTVFLANMSHELRTPLNSVIGFAELLEQRLPQAACSEHVEYAALIRQSGEHLLSVVNDLLDLSKIEAGEFSLLPEPVDLNEIASYCRHVMENGFRNGELTAHMELARGGVHISADQRACKQILINLLSNAVKFSRPGGVVSVRTGIDGESAWLQVADQGQGIAADLLPKLGRPFVQAEAAYSRSHEGAGLGLCIVFGLAKLHGGTVAVESTEGRGTTVTVRLPAEQAQALPESGACDQAEPLEAIAG